MDVVFIDKRTIRAYKRTAKGGVGSRALYYVAHFSHPFTQWNVRREVVRLENGEREHRCKAAFVFNLGKHDMLTVVSAVSEMSSDDALAHLNLKGVQKHISDERNPCWLPTTKHLPWLETRMVNVGLQRTERMLRNLLVQEMPLHKDLLLQV